MSKIYEIFGDDAEAMTIALMEKAEVAAMIPEGASIALKPNLVIAGKPESGATTHGGVLAGVISYLQSHGFKAISVIEGSWVGDDTDRAFHAAGYDTICKAYKVPFYNLKKDRSRQVDTPVGPIKICRRALDSDFLINLPVLKGHCQTKMTCALKNCKGCIPDSEKRRFHSMGLTRPIAALAAALKPALTIVDSICGDLDFEEGGNPIYTRRMLLGTDCVQIDTYGCQLMGLRLEDVPYVALAEQWGAGCARFDFEDLITLNQPETSAAYPAPSGLTARLTTNVEQRSACSACYGSLVRALYLVDGAGIRIRKHIAIGQGWRDKHFDGIGIGKCCNCAFIKVAGCPPTAREIADNLERYGKMLL